MKTLSLVLTLVFGFAGAAFADGHAALTYDQFEVSVPHSDLEECPASMKVEKAFCRMTMYSEGFHIFAFSEEGDQPLVGFKSFEEGDFTLTLK